MGGFRIEGDTSGNVAEVDASKQIKVNLPLLSTNPGFAALAAENDPGERTGSRYMTALEADDDFRLRVTSDSIVFHETFAGAALNSAQWSSTVTTFTTAVAGGYLKLNSGASAAANGVARVQSYRSFIVEHSFALYLDFPMQYVASAIGIANTTVEVGWFLASGTTAPTDGVFVRCNSAGIWSLVATYNGAESEQQFTHGLTENADSQFLLVVNTLEAELWIDNSLAAKVNRSAAVPNLTISNALPFTARVYNAAVAPASAVALWVGPVTVSRGGMVNPVSAADASALAGWGGYQGQSGGTMGYTANSVHSTGPVSATLAAATAGYATLGGQFQFVTVAGTETDYALFAYLVPAMAAGSFNRNLIIRGIRIHAYNMGAAVATTATLLQWQIGVGATQVTLATVADTATVKQSRRIPIGVQSFPVGAAVGTVADAIDLKFDAPLMAEPGTYVHVILKMPLGTATASQIVRGVVFVDCQYSL